MIAIAVGGAAVALAVWLLAGRRWAALPALAWAGLAGFVLAGVGAEPAPWAGDIGPQPMVDEVLAYGGPRVLVACSWVGAAAVGIGVTLVERRRAPRAAPGS
jgi:hypothetical protein